MKHELKMAEQGDETADLVRWARALEEHLESESYDEELLAQAESCLSVAFYAFGADSPESSVFTGGRPRSGLVRLKMCSKRWTHLVHVTESRRAQFSRPLIGEIDFMRTRTVRIVTALPEAQLCWIRQVYMPWASKAKSEYADRYFRIFWRAYEESLPAGLRLDRGVLRNMANLQVLSFGSWRADYLIQTEPLWEVFGMAKSNWHRRYAEHWRAMERALVLHHKRCLMAVLHQL